MDTGKACIDCCADKCLDFRDFVLRGNVVEIAVAFVVGGAFKEVVNAFVAAFITPLLGMIGSGDTKDLSFYVRGSQFNYGLFIDALISFIIICFILFYAVILPLMALLSRVYPNMATQRDCPECLMDDLPGNATKCKYCCSSLPPLAPKVSRFAKKKTGYEEITKTTTIPPTIVTTGITAGPVVTTTHGGGAAPATYGAGTNTGAAIGAAGYVKTTTLSTHPHRLKLSTRYTR